MADDLDELARLLAVPVDGLTDAELRPQIARETGIRQTTAYGWPSHTSHRRRTRGGLVGERGGRCHMIR